MKPRVCFAVVLLGTSALARQEISAVTTVYHTVTTYVPYEDHHCSALLLPKPGSLEIPQAAGRKGGCCGQVAEDNDFIEEVVPTGTGHEQVRTGYKIMTPLVTGNRFSTQTHAGNDIYPTQPPAWHVENPFTKTTRTTTDTLGGEEITTMTESPARAQSTNTRDPESSQESTSSYQYAPSNKTKSLSAHSFTPSIAVYPIALPSLKEGVNVPNAMLLFKSALSRKPSSTDAADSASRSSTAPTSSILASKSVSSETLSLFHSSGASAGANPTRTTATERISHQESLSTAATKSASLSQPPSPPYPTSSKPAASSSRHAASMPPSVGLSSFSASSSVPRSGNQTSTTSTPSYSKPTNLSQQPIYANVTSSKPASSSSTSESSKLSAIMKFAPFAMSTGVTPSFSSHASPKPSESTSSMNSSWLLMGSHKPSSLGPTLSNPTSWRRASGVRPSSTMQLTRSQKPSSSSALSSNRASRTERPSSYVLSKNSTKLSVPEIPLSTQKPNSWMSMDSVKASAHTSMDSFKWTNSSEPGSARLSKSTSRGSNSWMPTSYSHASYSNAYISAPASNSSSPNTQPFPPHMPAITHQRGSASPSMSTNSSHFSRPKPSPATPSTSQGPIYKNESLSMQLSSAPPSHTHLWIPPTPTNSNQSWNVTLHPLLPKPGSAMPVYSSTNSSLLTTSPWQASGATASIPVILSSDFQRPSLSLPSRPTGARLSVYTTSSQSANGTSFTSAAPKSSRYPKPSAPLSISQTFRSKEAGSTNSSRVPQTSYTITLNSSMSWLGSQTLRSWIPSSSSRLRVLPTPYSTPLNSSTVLPTLRSWTPSSSSPLRVSPTAYSTPLNSSTVLPSSQILRSWTPSSTNSSRVPQTLYMIPLNSSSPSPTSQILRSWTPSSNSPLPILTTSPSSSTNATRSSARPIGSSVAPKTSQYLTFPASGSGSQPIRSHNATSWTMIPSGSSLYPTASRNRSLSTPTPSLHKPNSSSLANSSMPISSKARPSVPLSSSGPSNVVPPSPSMPPTSAGWSVNVSSSLMSDSHWRPWTATPSGLFMSPTSLPQLGSSTTLSSLHRPRPSIALGSGKASSAKPASSPSVPTSSALSPPMVPSNSTMPSSSHKASPSAPLSRLRIPKPSGPLLISQKPGATNSSSSATARGSRPTIMRASSPSKTIPASPVTSSMSRMTKPKTSPKPLVKPSSSSTSKKSTTIYTKACPTPTCLSGIEVALFHNPYRRDMSRTYKSFNSAYFKSQKPLNQTITDLIYVRRVSKKNELANAALEYRTFLFACQNGTYKFVSDRSDDITLMWFGAKAYDKWDRSNADIMQYFYGDNRRKVVTRTIRAGTYYPIRVMWGNTGGAAALSLKIYAPDGRQLFGFGHNGGSYLTTEACDGSYRKHPPFGHER